MSVMIKIEMSNNHNTLGKDKIDIYNCTIIISPTIQNEKNRKKNTSSKKISENGSVEDIITLDTNTDMNNGG